MRFFNECTTLNEVKKLYRELANKYHPDKEGGDTETMKAINVEYAFAVIQMAKGEKFTPEQFEAEILNAEQYKDAVNAIINLEGIIIEVCGGWIWVTGNTYQHKQIFKDHGFYFASKKVAWYFRSPEWKTKNFKPMSLEEIRNKYGTQSINSKTFHKTLAA